MSKKPQPSRAQQQKTTVFVAVATFVGMSVLALVAWSLTRAAEPAPVNPAVVAASAVPVPPADHDHGAETFERITPAEAKALADAGKAVFLDVRSIEQYKETHVANAMHIPVTLVQGEIPYLPKDKMIVTYCTCPAEESSGEATMILARGGIQSKALHGGLRAWTDAGLPVAQGL
jgi:rhodanese-related sulfurtransferase